MKNLKEMQAEIREVNEANGWFESDRTVGDDVALLHSEVSEVFEAYRDGGLPDQTGYHVIIPSSLVAEIGDVAKARQIYLEVEEAEGRSPKPEGFGSECADVLIRLLDTCERRGVDLDFEYVRKIAFNRTRGHRHGGKRV